MTYVKRNVYKNKQKKIRFLEDREKNADMGKVKFYLIQLFHFSNSKP